MQMVTRPLLLPSLPLLE